MPTLTRRRIETRFPAMGSDAHVIVVAGSAPHLDLARTRVEALERRWTRFRDDSELSRLNRACGRPVVVSTDTYELVARAVDGWRITRGWFDPTVLPAMLDAGYDRDFSALDRVARDPRRASDGDSPARPAPGCDGIVLDPVVRAVRLPPGVGIDAGGIGKGLAADLVVAELLDAGAPGACVNLGGDLRVGGEAPEPAGWCIALDGSTATVNLRSGGVATSSRLRRRWWRAGREYHHLIDPRTGAPARSRLLETTVVAGEAALAEVLATAAAVAGEIEGRAIVQAAGATGCFLDDTGAHPLPGWGAFVS